jgi:hypothetical protein
MIYWVMKKTGYDMTRQDFSKFPPRRVEGMLSREIGKIQSLQGPVADGSDGQDADNYSYGELALIGADSTFAAVFGDTA